MHSSEALRRLDEAEIVPALAEALESFTGSLDCRQVCLIAEDRVGTARPIVQGIVTRVCALLRDRGVAAFPVARAGTPTWVRLTVDRGEGAFRLTAYADWGAFHRPRAARASWPWTETVGLPVFRADLVAPSGVLDAPLLGTAGLSWSQGPVLPWRILDLSAESADTTGVAAARTVRARCADGTRRLEIRLKDGRPSAIALRGDLANTEPPPRVVLQLPTEGFEGSREVPLRARAWSTTDPDVFVALDEDGRILYGADLGLWGPPMPGFGAGVVVFRGGFLSATAREEEDQALVHLSMNESRSLEVVDRIELGRDPIVALLAVDLLGDEHSDILVVQETAAGSRLFLIADDAGSEAK